MTISLSKLRSLLWLNLGDSQIHGRTPRFSVLRNPSDSWSFTLNFEPGRWSWSDFVFLTLTFCLVWPAVMSRKTKLTFMHQNLKWRNIWLGGGCLVVLLTGHAEILWPGQLLSLSLVYLVLIRPDFFYFMVYRNFWALFNVGIRNKNKNKISVIPDIHWLSNKRKPILTHIKKQTIQNDRKLNSRHFDTK